MLVCAGVARHQGRIIYLHYTPPASRERSAPLKSVYLVGKGVTYDTGGELLGRCQDIITISYPRSFVAVVLEELLK